MAMMDLQETNKRLFYKIMPNGRRREIDFKMVEDDFQLFQGRWSIEHSDKGVHGEALDLRFKDFKTMLAYTVEVKPKMWLPVRLVEGRLCNEIKKILCVSEMQPTKSFKALSMIFEFVSLLYSIDVFLFFW